MAFTDDQRSLVAGMFHQLLHMGGRVDIKDADARREAREALRSFLNERMPSEKIIRYGAPRHATRLIKTFMGMLDFDLPIDISGLDRDSTTYEALLFAADLAHRRDNN